jgi:hypothetical protein
MKTKIYTDERGYMKMKLPILVTIALAAMLVLAVAPAVFAENESVVSNETPVLIAPAPNTTSTTVDAETTAEINDDLNESVSGMRIGWERVKLGLTFNNEKKAMQELKLARLRLIQARIFAKNGNEKAMEKALDAHERLIERVKTRVNAIDGAFDNKSARLAAAKLVGLERAIEVHEARITKLSALLASENLTDAQKARIEDKLAKVEANTEKLKELEADKRDKLKTKLRAVTNMTESEAEAAIQEIEDSHNLSAVKALVAEKKAEHKERVAERLEVRNEVRQNVMNNLSEETRNEIRDTVRSEVEQRLEARANKSQ